MTFIYPVVLADSGVSHFRQLPLAVVISALFASSLSVFRTRAALQLEILAPPTWRAATFGEEADADSTSACGLGFVEPGPNGAQLSASSNPQPSSLGTAKDSDFSEPGKSASGQTGRPSVSKEIRKLIRRMSRENPLWAPLASTVKLLKSASMSARLA
jgi:hypothetical protein